MAGAGGGVGGWEQVRPLRSSAVRLRRVRAEQGELFLCVLGSKRESW